MEGRTLRHGSGRTERQWRYSRTPVAAVSSFNPLLDVVIAAAVEATAAERGWLIAVGANELVVVAGYHDGAPTPVGARGPLARGWAGFTVASQRPLALAPDAGDPRFAGDLVVGSGMRPRSLLCFPCRHGGAVIGALQLVDKAGDAPFSVDDVELVTWLAEIAGAAIDEAARNIVAPPPDPDALGAALAELAARDRARYATIAGVVNQLLQSS
jgi:GAF domain-containing protein